MVFLLISTFGYNGSSSRYRAQRKTASCETAFFERVTGIGPVFPPWQGDVIATIPYPLMLKLQRAGPHTKFIWLYFSEL